MNTETAEESSSYLNNFNDFQRKSDAFKLALKNNGVAQQSINFISNLVFRFVKNSDQNLPKAIRDSFLDVIRASNSQSEQPMSVLYSKDEQGMAELRVTLPPYGDKYSLSRFRMYFNFNGEGNLRIDYRPIDTMRNAITDEAFDFIINCLNVRKDVEGASSEVKSAQALENRESDELANTQISNSTALELPVFSVNNQAADFSLTPDPNFELMVKGRKYEMQNNKFVLESYRALCNSKSDNGLVMYEIGLDGKITNSQEVIYRANQFGNQGLCINKTTQAPVYAISGMALYDIAPGLANVVAEQINQMQLHIIFQQIPGALSPAQRI